MKQIELLLQQHFSITGWDIARSRDGQQNGGYYAQHGSMEVFVKFTDTDTAAALQRLGELAVAPRVLAMGRDGDRPYVIQEYVRGSYPDRGWFATHLPLLASCIRRYHSDQTLIELLSASSDAGYEEHLARDLAQLAERLDALQPGPLHTPEITGAFGELRRQGSQLQAPPTLVPVHIDPNTRNILLRDESMLLVDWDGVLLSDPMRDVGLLLWWYVAPRQWPDFFQSYGAPLDEACRERIFWWAARTSLAVAVWLAEHQQECAPFLRDFLAALASKGNPQAAYNERTSL